jgi:hypothetical protein
VPAAVTTFPVSIGGGLLVFPEDRGKVALKLTGLVRYDSGVLLQVYRSVSAEHDEAGVNGPPNEQHL